jgi:hypothetical protein
MGARVSKRTQIKLELTPDVIHQYIMAMAQLTAVKGLLLAENIARISGTDSPLDCDETLITTVHLLREGLGTLKGLRLHEHMLALHPNRAGLSVKEG